MYRKGVFADCHEKARKTLGHAHSPTLLPQVAVGWEVMTSALPSAVRLAELLGALSVATDHAAGQPPESALSATVVALRIARRLGVEESALPEIYYASLLRFLGCTSTASEAAGLAAGADCSALYSVTMSDWLDPEQLEASLRQRFATHLPSNVRNAAIATMLEAAPDLSNLASLHCLQAQILTRRLPVPAGAPELLSHLHERWDGKYPGQRGEAVPLGERIIATAVVAEMMRRAAGTQTALELLALRAGTQLDPNICHCVQTHADELFVGLDGAQRWSSFLASEPGQPLDVAEHELASVAHAFADYADQKSPWLIGHSRRVAGLSFLAADVLNIAAERREQLRLASLFHDIGRTSVYNGIWDKPGPLAADERQKAESHSLSTDQLLALVPGIAPLRELAASTHERGDGGGYHRRTTLDDRVAGLLAVADAYDALTHDRPWRPAYSAPEATEILLKEANAGRLPRDSTRAILEASGAGKRTAERAYPAGLSAREVDVLRLVAQGMATKQVAQRLGISAKTADHHIQNVYEKAGVRGRAAVAVFALEHGIVQQ